MYCKPIDCICFKIGTTVLKKQNILWSEVNYISYLVIQALPVLGMYYLVIQAVPVLRMYYLVIQALPVLGMYNTWSFRPYLF